MLSFLQTRLTLLQNCLGIILNIEPESIVRIPRSLFISISSPSIIRAKIGARKDLSINTNEAVVAEDSSIAVKYEANPIPVTKIDT